ncbi:MAG: AlpA family transcriptional regulator [Dehalococcoidia bacterium]|jgi:predicted DNA-binding transcriptional regulator AlpA|nr:AlpA family transcriptional regulator [Dehalococcoidia bacterium]
MAATRNKKPLELSERLFIRPNEIRSRYGIGKSTAYAWLRAGRFPPLYRLGPRLSAWRKTDLDKFFGLCENSQ